MLAELAVRDLGVIDEVTLLLDPGMTALTGETGAGKTMLVGAIGLLAGDRADAAVVRPGADEATSRGASSSTAMRSSSPGWCPAPGAPAPIATVA